MGKLGKGCPGLGHSICSSPEVGEVMGTPRQTVVSTASSETLGPRWNQSLGTTSSLSRPWSHGHKDPQEGQALPADADAEGDSIFIIDEVIDH